MKKENEVLGNFQVEELEKRFEMGWKNKEGRYDYGQEFLIEDLMGIK